MVTNRPVEPSVKIGRALGEMSVFNYTENTLKQRSCLFALNKSNNSGISIAYGKVSPPISHI